MKRIYTVIAIIVLGIITPCYAQPVITQQLDPATIETEIKRDQPLQNLVDEENKQKEVDAIDLKEETEVEKTESPSLSFKLTKVSFEGNTIIKSEDLAKYFDPLVDKEVSFDEINDSVDKITDLYKNLGFLTSQAYIPPQKISNGEIKINVFEGKIGEITLNKGKWVKDSFIKKNFLQTNNIQEKSVLNANNLRKSIVEINNIDYIKGKLTVNKSKIKGATDLNIEIEDRVPLDLKVGWNNTGKEYTGIKQTAITLANNNLSGYGDRLTTSAILASGLTGAITEYSVPTGIKRTRIRTRYSYFDVDIGKDLKSQRIDGDNHSLSAFLDIPIYDSYKMKIDGEVSFNAISSKIDSPITSAYNNKYEYRSIGTAVKLARADKYGRLMSKFEVVTGIPILGAKTKKEDESDASSKFVNLKLDVARLQYLPFGTMGLFSIRSQYSPFHLLAPEQMGISGMNSVRGYKEGVLYGDMGFVSSVELRKPLNIFPDIKIRDKKISMKNRLFLATFYDMGLAYELHQGVKFNHKNVMHSTGVGLVASLTKYINAAAYYGFPIGKDKYDKQKTARFHFGLSSDLF